MLHIKLKEWSAEHHESTYMYSVLTHKLDPWGGIKRSNIQLFQNMLLLHITIKGKDTCGNTVAIWWVKRSILFLKVVMLHIILT